MKKVKTTRSVQLGTPADIAKNLVPIGVEVDRLHESAMYSAQGQFEQTKVWRTLNLVLGVPAAVLAAISGGTGLAADQATIVPAVLALFAAGFGAVLTTLNPSRRITQSQSSANAYLKIQTDTRQFLLVRLCSVEREEAMQELGLLTERLDEVNRSADPPGRYAYWRAGRNINGGGQSYGADSKEG